MISFIRKVFKAQLKDLGFSGSVQAPRFLGYFTWEHDAQTVANEAAENDPSVLAEAIEEDLDVRVFDNVKEYNISLEETDVQSALSKLSDEELGALSKKILKDHKLSRKILKEQMKAESNDS